MAVSGITGMTNSELWEYAKKMSPQFNSHTAKLTYEKFSKNGWESIKYTGADLINEWVNVILMPVLQSVNISHAKDYLEEKGFGESFDTPYGGIIQRMAINSIAPCNPGFLGLENGKSVDPFVVYKPEMENRFFNYNFDYQSIVTIQEYQYKQIFASEYGMSETMAGIQEGLRNGWTVQKYLNKLEAINAGLNSTEHPLKDTQVVRLASWTDAEPTESELMEFISASQNVLDTMEIMPQYDGYNAAGFASTQDKSRLKMLVRSTIPKDIKLQLRVGAFNPEDLSLDIDMIKVPNFGGLVPYSDADYTTQVYPVYDDLGHEIGYAETEGASEATLTKDEVFWKDPNEDVLAIIADKGWIFTSTQNAYTVEPIRNPRGMYNNYFANAPHNAINVDEYYNAVVIAKPKTE